MGAAVCPGSCPRSVAVVAEVLQMRGTGRRLWSELKLQLRSREKVLVGVLIWGEFL